MNDRILTDRELLIDVHRRVAGLADVLLAGPRLPEQFRLYSPFEWIYDLSPMVDRSELPYIDVRLRARTLGARAVALELVIDGRVPVRRWVWNLDGEAGPPAEL